MPRPSRRAEVRTTAARLIRERGYDAATMDLLADEVGLNKGTLYHYYPSKSAILYDLLSEQVDATLALVKQVPRTGSATDRMRALIRLQVELVATKQDELVVFFQELPWIDQHLEEEQASDLRRRIDRYERFTRQLLSTGVRAGEFREMNLNMIMYSIIGILAYVPNWFRGTARKAQESLVDELSDFVISGILRR
ncbi:TetR/AcrR family transcriptional regulator [Phytohabitans kaempferiae]|uniref:TetR/AcrR family transcriptional regulator n=1 Tax=Phytohabitans kaempferiae TaxID=1620943 RepID=A0ABV6M5K0_9ACTN